MFFEDQQYWLQKPTDGLESEGYLVCKKDGVIIEERLLRKDVYKVVDGILVVGKNKRSE